MLTPCGLNCPDILRQILIYGLTNGVVLALNAISVTVIYGTVRALNLAHGDTFALTTVVITTLIRALGVPRNSPAVILIGAVPDIRFTNFLNFGLAPYLTVLIRARSGAQQASNR